MLTSKIGIGLIVVGIIGTFVAIFTKTTERFGSVFGRCIGVGIFLYIVGSAGIFF